MNFRSILPLTATIPPGETTRLSTKLLRAFRPERLFVSPHSFPLSIARRVWTWPIVVIGSVLGRVHRELAKLLHVDLHAAHERRQYVSAEYALAHADEVSWRDEGDEDEEEDRPFILVMAPPNRRERLLALLGQAARRLSQVRLRWQKAQLSALLVSSVSISKKPEFVDPIPADLFTVPAIDIDIYNAPSCRAGQEIEIDVRNGSRRACQLMMALIGTIEDEDARAGEAANDPEVTGQGVLE